MALDTIKRNVRNGVSALLLAVVLGGPLLAAPAQSPDRRSAPPVAVEQAQDGFHVGTPHPNPFSQTTTLTYRLDEARRVRIRLVNALGRPMRTLVDEDRPAGSHRVVISGEGLASGLYLIQVEAGPHKETRRVTYVR